MPDPRPSACKDLTTEDYTRTQIREGMVLFNYYDGHWGVVGEIRDYCAFKGCRAGRIIFDGKWIHEDYTVDDHEPDPEYFDGWFHLHQFNDDGSVSVGYTLLNGVRVATYDDNRKRNSKPPIGEPGKVLNNYRELMR
jgi:hypothetical protein